MQTDWWILWSAILFGLLVASVITVTELKRRCTKYRTAWGEARDRANDAQDKLARLNIRVVGIERENSRLRTEMEIASKERMSQLPWGIECEIIESRGTAHRE